MFIFLKFKSFLIDLLVLFILLLLLISVITFLFTLFDFLINYITYKYYLYNYNLIVKDYILNLEKIHNAINNYNADLNLIEAKQLKYNSFEYVFISLHLIVFTFYIFS